MTVLDIVQLVLFKVMEMLIEKEAIKELRDDSTIEINQFHEKQILSKKYELFKHNF